MEALIFIALFFIVIWFVSSKPKDTLSINSKPQPPRSETPLCAAAELNIYRYNKHQYLISPEWKTKRKQALKAANYSCQLCKAETDLHVHHISYKNLFRENPEDLVALCSDCHTYVHSIHGYPNTVEEYENFYGPINIDIKA